MPNKLWYESIDEENLYIKTAIQEYIDLYFFDSQQFKVVEDITVENLGELLKIVLKHYQQYHFHFGELYEIAEALEYYIYYVYIDDFPETCYPNFLNEDKRNLALSMLNYIQMRNHNPRIFTEDIPILIKFLNTEEGKIVAAENELEKYFNQFDYMKRQDESQRRWQAITAERQQALAENKPLPIRPMNIQLSMCYKI